MQMRQIYMNFALLAAFSAGSLLIGCQNKEPDAPSLNSKASASRLDDVRLAKVEGTFLYQSDVERLAVERGLIEAEAPFSQIDPNFAPLLEELIDQRLLSLGAVKRSLDQTSENKRRLANARERILSNILVENHLKGAVNETTIRRMYDEQAALANRGDEIRARHILVADEEAAKEVLKRLTDGESFPDLATELSLDEGSKGSGGDLGYFTRDMLDPKFTAVIFKIEEGARTEIFQSGFGWHIAEVIDRRPAQVQSFETLRPNIVQFLTYEAIQSLLEDLRRDSQVETLYEAVKPLPEPEIVPEPQSDKETETP